MTTCPRCHGLAYLFMMGNQLWSRCTKGCGNIWVGPRTKVA